MFHSYVPSHVVSPAVDLCADGTPVNDILVHCSLVALEGVEARHLLPTHRTRVEDGDF